MKEKQQSSAENNSSGDKDLWDLLGHAKETKAGDMFSRNVAREVRLLEDDNSQNIVSVLFDWFRKPVVLGAAAAVTIFACGLVVMQNSNGPLPVEIGATDPSASAELAEGMELAEEFESIDRLGELMAVSDPGLLSDEALMSLLF